MSGEMPVAAVPVAPPGGGWTASTAQPKPIARRLAWIGALVALAGAGLAVLVVTIEWTFFLGNVTAGTPAAALIDGLLYTYYASQAVIGVGVFLAALGFALRGPQRNNWFLLGGVLVLIGAVGVSTFDIYIRSLFAGGNFPGIATIQTLSIAGSIFGLMDPLGIGLILLGFVLPRGASWMG